MTVLVVVTTTFFTMAFAQTAPPIAPSTQEEARKVRLRVQPTYPELARRMNIGGVVKLQVIISPAGTVKSTKVIGGPPLLIEPAIEAMKRWRYEPGPQESTIVVEFKFTPGA
jgi:TonB family protein